MKHHVYRTIIFNPIFLGHKILNRDIHKIRLVSEDQRSWMCFKEFVLHSDDNEELLTTSAESCGQIVLSKI